MKINKLNYEVYAIDYIDGTLPEDMVAEMEQFLLLHPEVAKDVAMFNDMALSPDLSVKFIGKDKLKKPVQFAIFNYMHWIVPICISIAFMAAYPYIQPLWQSDNAKQEAPIQSDKTEQAKIFDKQATATTMAQLEPSVEAKNEISAASGGELSANKSTQKATKVINAAIEQPENFSKKTIQPVVTPKNKVLLDENGEPILDDNVGEHFNESAFQGDDEEKSIVDFGNNDKNLNRQMAFEIEPIENKNEIYPLEVSANKIWNSDELYIETPIFQPYLTFSIMPYAVGYDMAKTTNITSSNQLVRHITVDEQGEVRLERPQQFGVEVDAHLSKWVKIGSGFSITNRNLVFAQTGSSSADINVNYRTFAMPLTASFRMPVNGSEHQAINIRGGAVLNWMGNKNYTINANASMDEEPSGTATLLQTSNSEEKLLTTGSPIKIVPAIQFGLEYEKTLPVGAIILGFQYNRQMSNISTIGIWDYDATQNARLEGNDYQMRFETIMATVKYVLPYKAQL